MSALTLYGTPTSGHSHRVELLLLMLGLPYRFEMTPPATRRSPAFSALNLLQQIPVLRDGDLVLQDSNAILVYLAKRYDAGGPWLPEERIIAVRVQRWLSIAAGEINYGPARARAIIQWKVPGELANATEIAERVLQFMDGHLHGRAYLATDQHATIADLACYSYIAHAPEGGIPLDPYPAPCAHGSRGSRRCLDSHRCRVHPSRHRHQSRSGTYGDPNVSDPIQYDELRIDHEGGDV